MNAPAHVYMGSSNMTQYITAKGGQNWEGDVGDSGGGPGREAAGDMLRMLRIHVFHLQRVSLLKRMGETVDCSSEEAKQWLAG